jgi:hypothetical protein
MSANIVNRSQMIAALPDVRDALLDLYRLVNGALANDGKVTLANTLWVAKNGDNATAIRGRVDKPYSTVQGALNAMQTGDAIFLMPGTYTEDVTAPAAIGQFSVACIAKALIAGSFTWNPTDPNANMSLTNVAIVKPAPGPSLAVDASGAAFSVLFMTDVIIGGFDIRNVGFLQSSNLLQPNNFNNNLKNIAQGQLENANIQGAITVEWDQATAGALVRGSVTISNSAVAQILTAGQPSLIMRASAINGQVTSAGLTTHATPDLAPVIDMTECKIQGGIAVIFSPLQVAQAARNTLRADSCVLNAPMTVGVSAPDAVARAIVSARSSTGPTLVPGQSTDVDARGSQFDVINSAADGAVDRSLYTTTVPVPAGGNVNVPITPPYPTSVGSAYSYSTADIGGNRYGTVSQTPAQLTVLAAAADPALTVTFLRTLPAARALRDLVGDREGGRRHDRAHHELPRRRPARAGVRRAAVAIRPGARRGVQRLRLARLARGRVRARLCDRLARMVLDVATVPETGEVAAPFAAELFRDGAEDGVGLLVPRRLARRRVHDVEVDGAPEHVPADAPVCLRDLNLRVDDRHAADEVELVLLGARPERRAHTELEALLGALIDDLVDPGLRIRREVIEARVESLRHLLEPGLVDHLPIFLKRPSFHAAATPAAATPVVMATFAPVLMPAAGGVVPSCGSLLPDPDPDPEPLPEPEPEPPGPPLSPRPNWSIGLPWYRPPWLPEPPPEPPPSTGSGARTQTLFAS